jgi:hypothetical protein
MIIDNYNEYNVEILIDNKLHTFFVKDDISPDKAFEKFTDICREMCNKHKLNSVILKSVSSIRKTCEHCKGSGLM